MDLSELQATPSTAKHQSFLVNAHGDPLKINLQAVELEGRPKLVRTLKSSGALVVSNAKEAVIILVDSSTESGKRLIRTWGRDASKVVLEYTWVRASIDVGRPLLASDNWGGAMTVDDGKPVTIDGVVVDEDEIEEVEALVTKSPLPTPRVTPVDPASQRPENTVAKPSETTQTAPSTSRTVGPSAPAIVQSAVIGIAREPVASSYDDISPVQSPPLPPATQPLPYTQPPLFVQSSQPQNTYAYAPFTTQQLYPSQPQVMPTQPFSHTGLPSQSHQPQILQPPTMPHTPLPSVPSSMPQITANTTPMNGVDLQNFATIMTIMEVVRHMDQSNRFGQNHLPVSQPLVNSNASVFSEQPTTPGVTPSTSTLQLTGSSESPRINPSGSQHQSSSSASVSRKREFSLDVSEDHSVTRKPHIKHSRRLLDDKLAPSVSRKRLPAVKPTNPPPKRLRKGKSRAIISSDSSEHSEADELVEASEISYSTHSSDSPPARPRNIVAHRKDGEIFLSRSGQPLRFFVQVDLHGRHNVVTNIKKNKGKIVNNIADADYSILFARSETFQGLLHEAIALGKSPILAAFVADCVEEGALLDETDYILDSVAKVKALKRGRQNAFSIKVETSETLHHLTKTVKPKPSSVTDKGKKARETPLGDKKLKKITKSTASKYTAEGCEDPLRTCSPTPPAAGTRRMMKNGRYLFTEVEDEYVLSLARHHLSCDPTISNTALINKLHKKMPHHTSASWGAHVDKKLKGALEDIRKRANIAKRKRVSETVSQNKYSSRELVIEDALSKEDMMDIQEDGDIMPDPSQSSQEDLERQDFEAITHFFASGGGGDDDDDERVWQELEKHQPCRSANSWPEYYAAHQEQVYARIEELTSERAGD